MVREHEKAVAVAAQLGQFTANETAKGQFLPGNRRYIFIRAYKSHDYSVE